MSLSISFSGSEVQSGGGVGDVSKTQKISSRYFLRARNIQRPFNSSGLSVENSFLDRSIKSNEILFQHLDAVW